MKKFLSAMAMLMAVILIASCAVGTVDPNLDPNGENEGGTETLKTNREKIEFFESEEELLSFVEEHYVKRMSYYDDGNYLEYDIIVEDAIAMPEAPVAVAPGAPTAAGSATKENSSISSSVSAADSVADDVSSTNVQVEGIDEGDILKTDGSYIYIINANRFTIVDITGEKPSEVSTVELDSSNGYRYISEMYVKGDSAILIYNENVPYKLENTDPYPYGYYGYTNYTTVAVYDISDRTEPVQARKLSFEGSLVSSREMNGKLYLVSNKYFNRYYSEMPIIEDIMPRISDSVAGDCTPLATEIAKCIWPEPESNIMTIAIIDYLSDSRPETLSIMGSGSNIYMNSQNLYIFRNSWDNDGSKTEIVKYSITDGIEQVGTAIAPGYASTQFSYDEYNGKFRIATTSTVYNGEKYIDMNNIYVYDENMDLCGSLTGLAPDENIKSARFMGDVAYVVTFRQVDPLFVIDMSENDPKVLGELKIPGFSTYMHPVGDGLILGIGSETIDKTYNGWVSTSVSGLKVSLFDVSDPTDPKEIDVANYVGGQNAYSVAKDNHNAFVYSASTNTGYFPLTTYDDMWTSTDTLAEVKITDDGLDVRVADLERVYGYKYSDSRVCYAGEDLYLYRNFAITKLNRETLEFICEIDLSTP